ncbi:MAG TPA: hypothetical protein VMU60_00845 [Syntrophobacteria bacterium]|nr:hypothetical protein [Syntrophobacteria bacterium]
MRFALQTTLPAGRRPVLGGSGFQARRGDLVNRLDALAAASQA